MGDLPTLVLANAAAAAVLFAAAAVVCAVVRSPAVAHKAWLLVLVKLVTPPLVVLPVVWPAVEVTPNPGLVVPRSPAPEEVPLDVQHDGEPAGGETTLDEPRGLPLWQDETTGVNPVARPIEEPSATAEAPAPFPWRSALVAVWLGGTAAYWLLVAARVALYRKLLRAASPASPDVMELVRQTAGRLGLRNPPATVFVEAAVSPMVWAGLGRPRLVLPQSLWASLTPDQREAVLAHELAHLRRGDHWVRRLELLVIGLYWWFPVVWLASRRMRDAEEACCDAWVVWALPGQAVAYAEALVETVAFVSRPGWVPLASGGAARADALKRRLVMILSKNPTRRGRQVMAVGFVAAGLLVLPLRPGLADDVVKPVPPPPAAEPDAVVVFQDPQDLLPRTVPLGEPLTRIADKVAAPAADVIRIKDDLELLEAAGQIKVAQVRAAEVAVSAAKRKLDRVATLRKIGGHAETEGSAAESELEAAIAQLDVKKAELNEHMVKVKQAKRRLDEAQGTRAAADPAATREKKRLSDATAAEWLKFRPAELPRKAGDKDALKTTEAVPLLREELAKTIVTIRELTAQQKDLDHQLKVLVQQQAALMAHKQKLEANLQDLRKKNQDEGGTRKP